jgi:selenocysteine lyase/cysteine desulfurase
MYTRRRFLGAIGLPAAYAAVGAPILAGRLDLERALDVTEGLAAYPGSPKEIAADEEFWREVQQAFTVDRSLVNLNNGGVSPAPAVVQAAMKRYLDFSHQAPTYNMWRILEPQKEGVRQRLAREFGCDAEEVAITRNASESLEICQLGFDLAAGDEILTTNQDYPRMLATFDQRARREGIVVRKISIPVPAEDPAEVVRRFEAAIGPRTRLILICHMINITGQILPVREVVAMARSSGIPVIVDGAHALAHFDFRLSDLACDYYGSSLHKWLFAPHGSGLLYVRRDKIADLWPLMAAGEKMTGDIRKYEEIGTHPAANFDLPPGDRPEAQGGAARLPAGLLGEAAPRTRERPPSHEPRAGPGLRNRNRRAPRGRAREAEPSPVGEAQDHHDPDHPRGVQGSPDLPERLHDARGTRPVRRGDGRRSQKRAAPELRKRRVRHEQTRRQHRLPAQHQRTRTR